MLPAPFGVELLSEQRSTAEKMAGRLRNVEGARPWRAKELPCGKGGGGEMGRWGDGVGLVLVFGG